MGGKKLPFRIQNPSCAHKLDGLGAVPVPPPLPEPPSVGRGAPAPGVTDVQPSTRSSVCTAQTRGRAPLPGQQALTQGSKIRGKPPQGEVPAGSVDG